MLLLVILKKMNMNLNAYDSIVEKIDKTKTWIDIRKKTILSREIKYRRFTCLLKRYDVKTNITSYFIAMLDSPPKDRKYKLTVQDDYGRIKINISSIWKETYLIRLANNCNIMCELVESDDDGEIYSIDV